MADFVHLHLHSEYSLLESTLRVGDIPALAAGNGQFAAALTDTSALYAAVSFWRLCIAADIKPIIGCEVNVTEGKPTERSAPSHRIVLLCETNGGYRNLSAIVSKSFTEGMCIVPRTDYATLAAHSAGLICLSGGIGGPVSDALCAGDGELAKARASRLLRIFGSDCFFIELENHGTREERQILPELYALANEIGVGCVAANDVRYAHPDDAYPCAVVRCIKEGRVLSGGQEKGEYYFRSSEEMERLFGGFEGAIANTSAIAARCDVTFEFGKYHLPDYPLPAGTDAFGELTRKTFEGIDRLMAEKSIPAAGHDAAEYVSRAEYELSVIHGMGYDSYFLIVADYVEYAKKHGIAVGPGRGSGCGSLVAYATGITGIDPLEYGLYFERFLNPERVSMPDIDIDFDYTRRGEIVEYLISKYGREHVSQIITFGTLAARAAVRDASRVLGTDRKKTDTVCELIPKDTDVTVPSALEGKKLRALYDGDAEIRKMLDTAAAIEGLPRNVSVHAAGVVITSQPVTDYLPVAVSGDTVITQFDMTTVEQLGLLKFDLLSLRNLTVIEDACREIRRDNPDFDIGRIPLDDSAAYDMLCSGSTSGIFQLDKEGMRRVIMRIKPRSIGDIMTAIALYRPGPMDSIPKYLGGRKDPSSVTYPHPLLKPVLEPTYGCLIYQEQVMSVFRILAGYTPGRADLVRRAMAKKKADALEGERSGFIQGAVERNMTEEAAGRLFDDMTSFAGYAFNKSHAAAYAVITYRTAWLKARYPGYFFAALLNSVSGSTEKAEEYIAEAEKYGIKTEKPDINRSDACFTVRDGHILFGLAAIKSVGRSAADSCVSCRGEGYASLGDFVSRMPRRDMTRRTCEAFIKSGALDSLGVHRAALLCMLDRELEAVQGRDEGEMDIFSGSPALASDRGIPDVGRFSDGELGKMEAEYTGAVFTGRPEKVPEKASPAPKKGISKVYIRVPSEDSEIYRKCDNLCCIFCGSAEVIYYFADTEKYAGRQGGIDASPYVLRELGALAGDGSVVAR